MKHSSSPLLTRLFFICSVVFALVSCGGGSDDSGDTTNNSGSGSHTVSTSATSGGSITPANQTINHGATTTLGVIPDAGYHIASVTGCDGNLNGYTYTTDAIVSDCTVSAEFEPFFFTLADQSLNDGMISIVTAADGSGDIYVGGTFATSNGTTSNRIIRFNVDGTLDSNFETGSGFSSVVSSIVPAADGTGDFFVGGDFTSYNGTNSNRIIRLNSDGTVDSGFALGSGFDNFVTSIVQASDGSGDIYVAGNFTRYNGIESNHIVRLNSDGTVDSSFAVGTGFDIIVLALAPASDNSGDIYVGGTFTSYNGTNSNRIIRLNSDGTVDNSFSVGTGFDASVLTIAPATDNTGDLYLGGTFTSYNGTNSHRIIRLNSDGTPDTGFAVNSGFNDLARSISSSADGTGDIYVGGDFTRYQDTDSIRIVRLNSDGTVDPGFAVGTGFNGYVQTVTEASDGSGNIYLGGLFTSYQNSPVTRIASLKPDGSIR
ncbi:MAG: hypothetical protein P8171_19895 [Candidatus Thiodiazotropha sp.]